MAIVMVGKYWVHGIQTGGTNSTIQQGGLATANIQSARLTHTVAKQELMDSQGRKIGFMFPDDEELTMSFDLIPEGDSAQHALDSGFLPVVGTAYTLANFPVWKIGSWSGADGALNTAAGNKWYYEGGGTINFNSKEVVTMTVELHRYKNIA